MAAQVPHSPLQPEGRIQVLDILRGFALLGILLANMRFYSQPLVAAMMGGPTGGIDLVTTHLVRFLVEAKFYSLFSLLFGIGLFVQMTRAEAHGAGFGRLYVRRLVALGGIGAVHAFLLWPGDILTTYAVLGFVLLAFRNRQPRTLIVWALVFLVLPLLVVAVQTVVTPLPSGGAASPSRALSVAQATVRVSHDWQVYGHGSFAEVTAQRVRDFRLLLPAFVSMAPGMLCMFLTGLWVARRGLLHDVTSHRPQLVRIFAICVVLGAVANGGVLFARESLAEPGWRLAMRVMQAFGAPLLCFAYAAGIAVLAADQRWRRRLAPLGAAGRMALSNYLLQSAVCTTLFYGYGFGLLGRVGVAGGVALALALWSAQLVISTLWLRRFSYGPAEWVWRSLTYGRRPSMRRARADTASVAAA